MSGTQYITLMVSIIAMLNPLGNVAIYLAVAGKRKKAEQRQIVTQCTIAIAIILVIVVWIGGPLLSFFGISVGAFQVAGGLIVTLIGLDMLRAKQHSDNHDTHQDKKVSATKDSIGVVPLAMPIIAGPGSIAAIIAQANAMPSVVSKIEVSVGFIVIAICMGIILWFSPFIAKIVGESGMRIATRVMGLILTAIAFQMMGTGLKALLPGLA